MSSQILITGATGFIGRRLTRDLAAAGNRVRILARDPDKARALFDGRVEVTVGDMGNAASLARACEGVETIYNIAGIYRFGLRHRRELWDANVVGAENLFRSAAAAKVAKVVHLSSGGVLRKSDLAEAEASKLIDETDFPAGPPRFCSYKASKWHSEQRALDWARRGFPVVIASTTCPIGSGDEAPTPTGQIVRDFIQRKFPFYCRTGLNFIGVGDLSEGLQRVASTGRTGERYLLAGENLWLKEFLDLLAVETGLSAPRMCLPNALIRLIGIAGEAVDFLNPRSMSARVCLETSLHAERIQFFSNAKARNELGWKPAESIRESLIEAVAWYRQEAEIELAAEPTPSVRSHVQ
jgi:dihydroflavonol-4-reductase